MRLPYLKGVDMGIGATRLPWRALCNSQQPGFGAIPAKVHSGFASVIA
jgi:hypothetical protein